MKRVKGMLTVEAAIIVPLILVVFSAILYMLFYYHDKNVLLAATHEAAAFGSGREVSEEEKVEETAILNHLKSRIKGRLLLFSDVQTEITLEKKRVTISCKATKKAMSIHVVSAAIRTAPEEYIRTLRKIEKIGEKVGKEQ